MHYFRLSEKNKTDCLWLWIIKNDFAHSLIKLNKMKTFVTFNSHTQIIMWKKQTNDDFEWTWLSALLNKHAESILGNDWSCPTIDEQEVVLSHPVWSRQAVTQSHKFQINLKVFQDTKIPGYSSSTRLLKVNTAKSFLNAVVWLWFQIIPFFPQREFFFSFYKKLYFVSKLLLIGYVSDHTYEWSLCPWSFTQ